MCVCVCVKGVMERVITEESEGFCRSPGKSRRWHHLWRGEEQADLGYVLELEL